jgi:NADPH:quinone reductase-like Zn-dependent oxidoreductase
MDGKNLTGGSQYLPIQRESYQIMKAFIFERTGEPSEVLSLQEIAQPTSGPGEVLVRIRLSPVHPTDLHVQRGRFGRQPELPASPGMECVGVIETLGPGVVGLVPGTRVVLVNVWGVWRDFIWLSAVFCG